MDVLSILLKKRHDLTRFGVHVRAIQRAAYPQIFTDIDIVVGQAIPESGCRSVGWRTATGRLKEWPRVPGSVTQRSRGRR